MPKKDQFRYMISSIHNEGDIEDVRLKLATGWLKWKSASGVLYNRQITISKGKFYYECWTMKKQNVNMISVVEMRMLRWMSDNW